MATKNIKLSLETAKKLYKTAKDELKIILEENFSKAELSSKITDRITDFDDILEEAGKTYDEVVPWKNPRTKTQKSQNAVAKIQLITEIYNEGEVFDFKNTNQYKYYPYWEKKAHGGWVLLGVSGSSYSATLGSRYYF